MSQIRNALVIACSLAAVGGVAHADDRAVAKRLSTHGKLTSTHAKQLTSKVSERMARSADAPPAMIEPLRAALSQALLGTPMPPDGISAAKVRLKLYAGLNEFALEALFAPHPGAIASCARDLELSSKECEALVAAAGEVSLAQAKRTGGGPAPAPVAMVAVRGAQPAAAGSRFGGQPQQGFSGQPQQGSRFGGAPQQPQQGSRFGGAAPVAAQQQPMQQQPMQQQQPARFAGNAPPQQNRFGGTAPVQAAPAAAPAFVAAAPQPQAAVADVNPQDVAARKADYQAKQEARMARMKAEFEARRQRTLGGLPGDAPPDVARPVSAPAAASEAKPAAASAAAPTRAVAAKPAGKKADIMDEPLAEPETALDADMKAAVGGKQAAPAPASGGGKAGLDGDFLDGLLDDPTGGKKK